MPIMSLDGRTADQVAEAQRSAGGKLGSPVQLANSLGMEFVLIPAGTFAMGSPDDEPDRKDNEALHPATIARAFYLSVYEVTQAEYTRVLGRNESYFAPTGPGAARVAGMDMATFPAECVTWNDARTFCQRLSALPAEQQAGRVYRLPTEAEWEYACRAASRTPYYFGATLSGQRANCDGTWPYGTATPGSYPRHPRPVGSYAPNAFGLYDMHGNVWEWCADEVPDDGESLAPPPAIVGKTPLRVIRGGGWRTEARRCRSAYRGSGAPAERHFDIGFRVAFTAK